MASGTWNTGFWGQNQWGDNANPTVILTGFGMSATLGNESSSTEINVGWGRQEWGLQGWGIAGTLIPTGISATFNLGTVDASPDAMPTGIAATMGIGTVEAFNNEGWGRLGWSINDWGDAGSSIQVDVTGIAMTAALGTPTEITGDATITANTLNVAQLTLGVVDPAPDAMITGNFMIGALGQLGMQGDVSSSVTGLGLSANLGSVTVDLNQQVNLTGNAMIARVASVTAFTDVTATFNGFGLTMNINSANALIWNDVNTGSAPIDPPGWREVVA